QGITGRLVEGEQPIQGAKVWWSGTSIGAISNSNGFFEIEPPPSWPGILRTDHSQDSLLVPTFPSHPIHWDIAAQAALPTQRIEADYPGVSLSSQSVPPLQTWDRRTLTAAPCCNLSEAFEGTAIIDATLSDGALGVRQLRLMGFEPAHSPLWYESKPLSLGLYRPWAANFVPALWIQSLSLAKGIGSVLYGFDGPAGQVQLQYLSYEEPNFPRAVEWVARTTGETFLSGRWQQQLPHQWTLLALGNIGWTPFQSVFLQDHNGDGFLDIPLFKQGHGLLKGVRRDSIGNLFEVEGEALFDYRWGGEVTFQRPSQIASLEAWGTYQRLTYGQTSVRRGWVLPKGRGLSLLGQIRLLHQALQAGFNRYVAQQPLSWAQLIYRQPIGDTRWIWQGGISAQAAFYAESLTTWHGYDTTWQRLEFIPGAFSELTLTPIPQLSIVLGGRADWHSYWGWQLLPRAHLRWQYALSGSVRLSGGRSWRVPDPLPESFPFLMSSRQWSLHFPGWPAVESAWSYGFFWQHSLAVGPAILRLSIDGVRATLRNPLLWVIERPWEIQVFSSPDPSLYQTLYAEIAYELPDRFRIQVGYKHQEVWQPLEGTYRLRPLLPKDRLVVWSSWMTLSRRWQVDAIGSWIGPQRLPSTQENPLPYRLRTQTPAYLLLTMQLTHRIDQWEIQIAGENLTGFRQSWPVVAADRPFSPYFDASLIWGPIMGRWGSVTLRYSF
ncbi:MAG: TonB-dependent receptor, partial [Bacteroidia bacterium]|nr:TonB-dependent receptor [Bacteroidia bacterium]